MALKTLLLSEQDRCTERPLIKTGWQRDGLIQDLQVLRTRDLMTAKAGQMRGGPLRVMLNESTLFEPPLQMRESHF